ncbi:hypothetical protein B6N60_00315 [Richelia sinica FACHB-800]|uniref:Uncharacterized protein n=1 Tax=Richelia sinica FACHB-800 TaxID=1357546 RepID=A0A975T536_9NOST|nr:hypothetical protein [Richelia sinica]MBD2665867.1 hypothetical protein [Richelia sinica FACHB-800]QXE21638.1 hypothetical protein B6N60_00315 [Richelia sinica FACHB-800]
MKTRSGSLALILSLAVPLWTSLQTQAFAKLPFPDGEYFNPQNGEVRWHLTLWEEKNKYFYKNTDLQSEKKICLTNGTASGNKNRSVFTWRNKGYKYQIAWRPQDPDVVRLQVINPSGKTILNELLKRQPGEFEDPNATKC